MKMNKDIFTWFNISNFRHKLFLFLVFFISFLIALFPLAWQGHLYRTSISLLFFSSLLAIDKHRKALLAPVLLAIFIQWVGATFDLYFLEMASKLLYFLFFLYMTGYFIHEITKAEKVTLKLIMQSIIGYLLLGIVFSILVAFLDQVDTTMYSFQHVPEEINGSHFSEYLYFGFVTLTTVGYGEIVPLQPVSRSLSILISVSGQLYLAIIIALLVGKYVAKRDP